MTGEIFAFQYYYLFLAMLMYTFVDQYMVVNFLLLLF